MSKKEGETKNSQRNSWVIIST